MLYFAPLQGYTDYIFRKVFSMNFCGIDAFFIPYISYRNEKLPVKQLREVLPANNINLKVVPQVLVKNSAEARYLFGVLEEFGYREINLNMGCPYPMVTSGGRGAGLLTYSDNIREILDGLLPLPNCLISVKIRSGMKSEEEIRSITEVLNQYPLSEIIYHPRLATQLYKGSINEVLFNEITLKSKIPVSYNGDIFSKDDFEKKKMSLENVNNWMLGRGILMNPFLPAEIKGKDFLPGEKAVILESFHEQLIGAYSAVLSGPGHLLTRMKQHWEYFCHSFPEPGKTFKMIRKSNRMDDYLKKIRILFKTLKNS